MPTWFNIGAVITVLTAIYGLMIWKLAITIAAKANKADHSNAFGQSLVGLISLFWAAVALGGTFAVIGYGIYNTFIVG